MPADFFKNRWYQVTATTLFLGTLFFVSFGNADAAHNIFGGLAAILGLAAFLKLPIPLRVTLFLFLSYCLVSASWALSPEGTLRGFLAEALMPVGIFILGFYLASFSAQDLDQSNKNGLNQTPLLVTLVGALLLFAAIVTALIGLTKFHGLFPGIRPSVERYWSGVGQVTTIVAYWFVIAFWLITLRSALLRVIGLVLMAFCLWLATFQPNRAVWISFGITSFIGLSWVFWVRFGKRSRIASVVVVSLFSMFFSGVTVQKIVTDRYGPNVPVVAVPGQFLKMVNEDPRVAFWPYWDDVAETTGLFGNGFGQKNVVESRMLLKTDAVSAIDRQGLNHSHNLFLNYQIQLGLVGMTLLFAVFVSAIFEILFRSNPILGLNSSFGGLAALTLLLVYVQKNFTDVWTLYGPNLLFWALFGLLLGSSRLKKEVF